MIWTFAEAKSRFDELVGLAIKKGPQRIQQRGKVVVLLSNKEYEHLKDRKPSFKDFLLNGPDLSELDLERKGEG